MLTTVILAPGACGREGPSPGSGTGSGGSAGSPGSGGSGGSGAVSQSMVSCTRNHSFPSPAGSQSPPAPLLVQEEDLLLVQEEDLLLVPEEDQVMPPRCIFFSFCKCTCYGLIGILVQAQVMILWGFLDALTKFLSTVRVWIGSIVGTLIFEINIFTNGRFGMPPDCIDDNGRLEFCKKM